MRFPHALIAALVLCGSPEPVAAQFRIDRFTTGHGLPQNTVSAIAHGLFAGSRGRLYESRGFLVVFGALALVAGSVAYALRVRRLKRNERRLTDLVESRTAELQERSAQLEVANGLLAELAALDSLTGLANRRRFDTYVQQEWLRAQRSRRPLALLMVDADLFKTFNDKYGHQAGDDCLKRIATVLLTAAHRGSDLPSRYGGEEFAVVLPDTESDGALLVAEMIRANIEALGIPHVHGPSGMMTVSIGVATTVPTRHAAVSELIEAADKALYEAKAGGRNQVRAHSGSVSAQT